MFDINDKKTQAGLGCILSLLQATISKNDFAKLRLLLPDVDSLIVASEEQSKQPQVQYSSTKNTIRDFADLAARFKLVGLKPVDIKVFFSCLVEYVSERGDIVLAKKLTQLIDSSIIFSDREWQIYRNSEFAVV